MEPNPIRRVLARLLAVALLSLPAGARAADSAPAAAEFVSGPTAEVADGKVFVRFEVNRATDVAVYVLNAQGGVVRHLVAGVLGPRPPVPLKPGLSQSIEWDGRDDDGEKPTGGPFKVRVAAGLAPAFDGFLLHDPDCLRRLATLACGPQGSVYVFYRDATSNPNQGGVKIKVLDREGRHDRMLLPYPADLSHEKVRAMGAFQDEQGRLVPRIYSWQTLSFYPDPMGSGRGRSIRSSPAVDSKGTVHWMLMGGKLASLSSDGGSPYGSFLSEPVFTEEDGLLIADPRAKQADPVLAVGEEDRFLYVSNLLRKQKGVKGNPPVPCVYRIDLKSRGRAMPFVGRPDAAGEAAPLIAPMGIACAKGIVYVADPGANRVAAFRESDGGLVGQFNVDAPQFVGVDPGSGAVYVVCRTDNVVEPDLVKYDGIQTGREVCRVTLPADSHTQEVRHRISVDASQKPVRIWAPIFAFRRDRICGIDDTGEKLVVRDEFGKPEGTLGLGGSDLEMDRRRGDLYVRAVGGGSVRIEEGMWKVTPIGGDRWRAPGQLVPCPDGGLISYGNSSGLQRWTRDGKPLPWEGADTNSPEPTGVWTSIMTLGPPSNLAVHDREVYVVPPGNWREGNRKSGGGGICSSLNVHGMDGKVARTAVWQCGARAIPRVDARGNIYLADGVKPRDRMAPEFFDGKRTASQGVDPYNYIYGSIAKFPPGGGAIWLKKPAADEPTPYTEGRTPADLVRKPEIPVSFPGVHCRGLREGTVQGALWVRFGFAPYSMKWEMGVVGCHCENAGFDVDPFGRVFYPDLGRFRVEVVDTDNNWIGSFGHYGNQDSGGRDAKIKTPEIPLAWPTYVAVSDRYAYVSDTINLRIVRVKLDYAADATCAVPSP